MQAVFRLILEGLAMFVGSWAAGCVPLYVRMEAGKFNLLALFGAGLLIGAALAVILPEGVETLARALLAKKTDNDTLVDSMNNTVGWSLVAGFCVMFLIDNLFPSQHSHEEDAPDNDSAACLDEIPLATRGGSEFTLNDPMTSHRTQQQQQQQQQQQHQYQSHGQHQSQKRGIKRVLGMVGSALAPRGLPSTLIGILVHSCADGLALGAAVAGSAAAAATATEGSEHTSSMELVVFMALLLHKAPAAFGLITTLKQQGYASYKLSIWLTIFAASAPLSALTTFSMFLLIGKGAAGGVQPWAGTVMLFSAGTFMYVAMAHTLSEAVHQAQRLRAKAGSKIGSLSLVDILVLLLGVVLPPLVSKDHDE
ncbi:hypothetical protein GGI15_004728 [Coemansia interrupta]|uniref:Uncharacterized protein n=1 Tax=Coemansia interrupta TaxID=1126814 RepID=A0A9W8LFA4_9FUNG|nr:hypothetical protein GGI15_004728 [Coemansia interrupta]